MWVQRKPPGRLGEPWSGVLASGSLPLFRLLPSNVQRNPKINYGMHKSDSANLSTITTSVTLSSCRLSLELVRMTARCSKISLDKIVLYTRLLSASSLHITLEACNHKLFPKMTFSRDWVRPVNVSRRIRAGTLTNSHILPHMFSSMIYDLCHAMPSGLLYPRTTTHCGPHNAHNYLSAAWTRINVLTPAATSSKVPASVYIHYTSAKECTSFQDTYHACGGISNCQPREGWSDS